MKNFETWNTTHSSGPYTELRQSQIRTAAILVLLRGWKKQQKAAIKMADVPIEILTGYLPLIKEDCTAVEPHANTQQKCSNLAWHEKLAEVMTFSI
jgi:hypothetical protein